MCQVCRRTLLAGERYRTWRWARRDQTVCVVCEPEAREAGAVRVVDAFECVRVSGLIQNVDASRSALRQRISTPSLRAASGIVPPCTTTDASTTTNTVS